MTTVGDTGISPVLLQAVSHLSGSTATRTTQELIELSGINAAAALKTLKVGNAQFVIREAPSVAVQVTPKDRAVLVLRKVKDENAAASSSSSSALTSQWLTFPGPNIVGQLGAEINDLPQNWVSLAQSLYTQQQTTSAGLRVTAGNAGHQLLAGTGCLAVVRNRGFESSVDASYDDGVQEIEVETQPFDCLSVGRLFSDGSMLRQQQLAEDTATFSPSFDRSSLDVSRMMQLGAPQDENWSSDPKHFRFDDIASAVYTTVNSVAFRSSAVPRVQVVQNSSSNTSAYHPLASNGNGLLTADQANVAMCGEPCPVCGDKISGDQIIHFVQHVGYI